MKVSRNILVGVSCLVLLASGCAKSGVVKKDDVATPVAAKSDSQLPKVDPNKDPKKSTAETKQQPKSDPKNDILNGKTPGKETTALQPVPNAGELKVALDNIYFNFDSATLSQEARNTLVKTAETLKKNSKVMIRIEGNCDERGSEEYNLALGEKRARVAMQYLATLGIPEKNLSFISYGKEKPVALGHDDASWAKNRRDEFVIVSK